MGNSKVVNETVFNSHDLILKVLQVIAFTKPLVTKLKSSSYIQVTIIREIKFHIYRKQQTSEST